MGEREPERCVRTRSDSQAVPPGRGEATIGAAHTCFDRPRANVEARYFSPTFMQTLLDPFPYLPQSIGYPFCRT